MLSPSLWNEAWSPAITTTLVNHLWQSTAVVLAVWLLTLALRRNQATLRYRLWMIASIKFLVPLSLLIAMGKALRPAVETPAHPPALAAVVQQMTQPFSQQFSSSAFGIYLDAAPATTTQPHFPLIPFILFVIWLCGCSVIAISWTRQWLQIRRAVRTASQMTLIAEVPVLSTTQQVEPGIFGIVKPVLLMPANIADRLSTPQLRTIIAHEMCHVCRRDNLTAAIHMVVQALFWFHPAVWWIKARLLEERERACDEAVLQAGNAAEIYAESILSVCRFYVESPVACVSGVTGSDLKQRIIRIMTEQVIDKLDLRRKLLLGMAAIAAVAVPVATGLMPVAPVHAQTAAVNPAQSLADTWQGTLHAGRDLRTVVKISKADGGGYKATFYSIDQGGDGLPVTKITLDGTAVHMTLTAIGGTYEGKLSGDGKTITGTWSQGANPLPLVLTRATPETEWTVPPPTPRLPPMDANANPSFEVATVKPSKPDAPGKAFLVRGRRFSTINTTLGEIISFAYGVQAKQVIGAPPWVATDKYDITAEPDGEGAPSDKQWKSMMQKLLADRFKLTFHRDKRELSVYVLSVAKTGQKLTKSDGDPNGLPGLFFRGLGDLNVRNATMTDFTNLMQSGVLDRPVVDQTNLAGRYDFTLKWTPDDSQFAGAPAGTPPSDKINPPPNLYTAIQEQIGLKLDATHAPAEVLVIDHVEKPSEN